ncbi:MAG TPA: GNAT family N-acetyltransferase [Candidatus Limnocylindrales bacterium]|nr:GNAT family N-acetyltransferase [Candidatus Limnocylindrales bacterium]
MDTRTTAGPATPTTPRDSTSGLRLRPYAGERDLAEIVRLENAEAEADGLQERVTLEGETTFFAHPNDKFDPGRDVTIAEVDGRPIGVGFRNWVETTDGFNEYRINGAVDPAWRRRGVGTALVAENLRRMRELAVGHDVPPERKVLGSWTGDSQPGAAAVLSAAGFAPIRWFFLMTRPTLDDVPDLALPEGLEIRPVTEANVRAVWAADIESFRDHWGGFDGSEVMFQRWMANPHTDLSLWLAAFDGDEVAGGVLNAIDPDENEALGVSRGWLHSVFTRRPWRRRGLAAALIVRSLDLLRERGMTSGILGVDAENPSGALGLYERLGFVVSYRSTAWRRAL